MGMGSQGVPQIGPLDLGYTTGIPLYLGVYHWDTPVSGYPAGIPLYLGYTTGIPLYLGTLLGYPCIWGYTTGIPLYLGTPDLGSQGYPPYIHMML